VLKGDDTSDTAGIESSDTADTGQPVDEPEPAPYGSWLLFEAAPAGSFDMGCTRPSEWPCSDDERPAHTVTLSAFSVMKTEVTRGMYRSVTGSAERPSGCTQDDCALVGVTWLDAIAFCNRISELEGLSAAYTISGNAVAWDTTTDGWRLPTEAEWEYAARGNRDLLYAGSSDLDQVAWTTDSSGGRPHEVGEKLPNDYRLVDMSGNVAEWVWDLDGPYGPDPTTNPTGPSTGDSRVLRGGSWSEDAERARVSARGARPDGFKDMNLGFRMVRGAL
jgi:formylglycine-generating enzyme required for sulfatase activity